MPEWEDYRRLKRVLRGVERRALGLGAGNVVGQPRFVKALDGGDVFEPCLAPAGEVDLPDYALDEVPALMDPKYRRITRPPSRRASIL